MFLFYLRNYKFLRILIYSLQFVYLIYVFLAPKYFEILKI